MKRIKYFIAAIFLATPMLLTTGIALAHDETSTDDTQQTQQLTQEQIAEKIKELKDRLESRKAEFKTKLTEIRASMLGRRCKSAQAVLGGLSSKVTPFNERRLKVYENLDQRITKLLDKLKDNPDIDTTNLAQLQTELQGKIADFKTDVEAYQQTLDDLKDMDCTSDKTAFQASLDAARAAREKVVNDLKDIRSLINDQIKVSIKAIKDSLENTNEQENNQ